MRKELDKSYNPGAIEKPLYQKWCDAGYFTPTVDKSKKPSVNADGLLCFMP